MKTIIVDGQYVVASDDVLRFKDQPAFSMVSGDPAQLINHGSVSVTSAAPGVGISGVAVGTPHGASFFNDVDASFTVTSTAGGRADGFDSQEVRHSSFTNAGDFTVSGGIARAVVGGYLDFANLGDITVTAQSVANGVIIGHRGSFANSGSIDVDAGQGGAEAVTLEASDIDFVNDGTIHAVGGSSTTAVYGAQITNTGSIIAEISITGLDAVAVSLDLANDDPFAAKLVNSGLIQGNIAIQETGYSVHGLATVIRNDGQMVGDVDLGDNPDRLTNNGDITGAVNLGEGDDRLLGARGFISDIIDGGAGDDLLIVGDEDDTIMGGAGDDTISGGKGGDRLYGGDGKDTFWFHHLNEIKPAHGDFITDLHGSDVIDLSLIDADTTQGGDQAFVLVAALDGHAGEAAFSYDAEQHVTSLLLDVDGDGKADGRIDLQGDQQHFTSFVL